MPVVLDPDRTVVASLLTGLPPGAHAVEEPARLASWLEHRVEEYVVVLGPTLDLDEALRVSEGLRITRPTTSIVLVRDHVDAATLTGAMHAGARDVVRTADLAALGAAVERAYQLWVALRGPAGASHSGRVISVFSPKGGVGKTTMAVNLALALSDGGSRQVCLVDLDLAFGDVAITLQLFPSHSIEHAIGGEDALDFTLVESLLTRHEESLMVLAAPSLPDARERITPVLVSRMLRTLREKFDFVVVDTAPSFDEQTLTALDETDECVIVATLDVPTLKNVKVAIETLDMLDVAPGHRHLLLNRADDAVGISADKVESILGLPVVAQVATSLDIAAATNAGRPIVLSHPDHASSAAVRGLAARLRGEPESPTARPSAVDVPSATGRSARRFRIRR